MCPTGCLCRKLSLFCGVAPVVYFGGRILEIGRVFLSLVSFMQCVKRDLLAVRSCPFVAQSEGFCHLTAGPRLCLTAKIGRHKTRTKGLVTKAFRLMARWLSIAAIDSRD